MNERITIELIFHFMLIFARLGTAFGRFPALSAQHIFSRGRLAFALVVSFILIPVLQPYLPPYSHNFSANIGYLAIEILIGLIISIASNIYFQSLYTVTQIISLQSGLGSAAFFDPLQKSQMAVFSTFISLATIVFIFATDTHYLFINAVADSYIKFPPGEALNAGDLSKFITHVVNNSFILAFKLVSPFLVVSLAMITGTGILARLMPNLQVFFVITPAQIIVTFSTMYIVIEAVITKLVTAISNSLNTIAF